jgi:hypothetical protein
MRLVQHLPEALMAEEKVELGRVLHIMAPVAVEELTSV